MPGDIFGAIHEIQRAAAFHQPVQVDAFDELHGEVRPWTRQVSRIDGDDVRMIQQRDCTHFAAESLQVFCIIGAAEPLRRNDLERGQAIQTSLTSLVDDPHAAAVQCAESQIPPVRRPA